MSSTTTTTTATATPDISQNLNPAELRQYQSMLLQVKEKRRKVALLQSKLQESTSSTKEVVGFVDNQIARVVASVSEHEKEFESIVKNPPAVPAAAPKPPAPVPKTIVVWKYSNFPYNADSDMLTNSFLFRNSHHFLPCASAFGDELETLHSGSKLGVSDVKLEYGNFSYRIARTSNPDLLTQENIETKVVRLLYRTTTLEILSESTSPKFLVSKPLVKYLSECVYLQLAGAKGNQISEILWHWTYQVSGGSNPSSCPKITKLSSASNLASLKAYNLHRSLMRNKDQRIFLVAAKEVNSNDIEIRDTGIDIRNGRIAGGYKSDPRRYHQSLLKMNIVLPAVHALKDAKSTFMYIVHACVGDMYTFKSSGSANSYSDQNHPLYQITPPVNYDSCMDVDENVYIYRNDQVYVSHAIEL